MAVDLTILVGTMTGTAELCAEEISDQLEAAGHSVQITPMDGQDSGVFDPTKIYLICTSTYGQGDVPDNAIALYEDLQDKRPDLGGMRYGVVALGDRTYAQTFTDGGKRFDKVLGELNAKRIGDMFQHDASSGTIPEEESAEWALSWIQSFNGDREKAA